MNKDLNTRNYFIHLYNPKKEGVGSYDVNYINAHKNKNLKDTYKGREIERKAA